MIPTPDLSHLTSQDYELVYEPAEDTFLFLDALEAEAEELMKSKPTVCLEIGSGSGCVSAFVANILGSSVLYLCTDINPRACLCTKRTAIQNNCTLECINTSFACPLSLRLQHGIDIILFNPPYVPTVDEEAQSAQETRTISGSWAGGNDGMQVTNAFLDNVKVLLSEKGRFYLVLLKQNDIPRIQRRMLRDHSLEGHIVMQRRGGREHLFVLRFTHQNNKALKKH